MRKAKKTTRAVAKKRPVKNFLRRCARTAGRIHWPSIVLRAAALFALVTVELAVMTIVEHLASDPVTAVILKVTAGLGGLGVVLGPSVALSFRKGERRKLAWIVVGVCFATSAWNQSTALANGQALSVAATIKRSPTYADEVRRLPMLNRRIDALSDEYDAEAELSRITDERDRIQARVEAANPQPVMFAWKDWGILYWLKAALFHGLVAGFSAAFAVPMAQRSRRQPAKAKAPADWPYVGTEPVSF